VPERQESAEADEEIERAREEREAQQLHRELRIHEERRDGEGRDHHRQRAAVIARFPGGIADGGMALELGHQRCPKSPCGRIMRTTAITTKITVLDASG